MNPDCRIISIFSTKGGVGKTLIATNLAASLHAQLRQETAFLELSPAAIDAATMLGSTHVQRVTEPPTEDTLPGVLRKLSVSCDYIIIDAGSGFSPVAMKAFEWSNLILLVTTPDLISVTHVHRAIEQLERQRFPLNMVRVIVNRAESRGHLPSQDVKEAFPVDVVAELPSDGRLAGFSVNQSIPLALSGENSRIQQILRRFAKTLHESPGLFMRQDHRAGAPSPDGKAVERLDGAASDSRREDVEIEVRRRIHAQLIERLDLKRLNLSTLTDPAEAKRLRDRTEKIALELMVEAGGFVEGLDVRQKLVKEILDEALGLGPLEDLLNDDGISDILVNGKDQVYIERHGKLSLTGQRFISNEQLLTVIERIIAPLGRRIDESTPMVDARLPDGSRVNAIIQPLSIKGPVLSIRKFGRRRFTIDELLRLSSLSPPMADFLRMCVISRRNMIVSGGTGSGKTTMLNVLSAFIPETDRIVTIEDAAELRLSQEHWVPLEARPPNIEGRGQVAIRDLFRNALRMRPDRIIIGECRSAETLDMLQAMNTGHDGSLTTLHANSPHDVITRLDSLILMSNIELPIRAIREQIVSAVDLIVHTSRMSDGSRKVTHITEITGMDAQADVAFRDLFTFAQQGMEPSGKVLGVFSATGALPTFLDELKARGLPVDERMFRA